jgi:hypothetical protein
MRLLDLYMALITVTPFEVDYVVVGLLWMNINIERVVVAVMVSLCLASVTHLQHLMFHPCGAAWN